MTRLDEVKREKLQATLNEQNSKKVPYRTTPAIFRETALDTHTTLPVEDWGPTTFPPQRTSYRESTYQQSKTYTKSARQPEETQELYTSVFKPSEGQRYVCDLATQRRKAVAESEWALLAAYEVEAAKAEKTLRQTRVAQQKMEQKAAIEEALAWKEEAKKRELEEKMKDRENIANLVVKYKQDEQAQAAAARQAATALKQERLTTVAETKRAVEAATTARRAEEAAVFQAAAERMEAEKARAAAMKAEATRQQRDRMNQDIQMTKTARMERDRMEREREAEAVRMREVAEKQQQRMDHDYKASLNSRQQGDVWPWGTQQRSDSSRSARLAAEAEAKAEAAAKLQEAEAAAARLKLSDEARIAASKEVTPKYQMVGAARPEREALDETVRQAAVKEEETRRARFEAARKDKAIVAKQITEQDQRRKEQNVGMDATERKINKPILEVASAKLGTARQVTPPW